MTNQSASDDKTLNGIMLLVSTGAFSLSLTFFLNTSSGPKCIILLGLSWAFLAISILFNATGYYVSRKKFGQLADDLNNAPSKGEFTLQEYNAIRQKNNGKWKMIDCYNGLTFISFVLGLTLLTVFTILQI